LQHFGAQGSFRVGFRVSLGFLLGLALEFKNVGFWVRVCLTI
jgi:hypothetical protein